MSAPQGLVNLASSSHKVGHKEFRSSLFTEFTGSGWAARVPGTNKTKIAEHDLHEHMNAMR